MTGLKKHIINLVEAIILAFIFTLILGTLWSMGILGVIFWLFVSVICYVHDKAKITLDDIIFDIRLANGIVNKLLVIFIWIVLGVVTLYLYPILAMIELIEKLERLITRK